MPPGPPLPILQNLRPSAARLCLRVRDIVRRLDVDIHGHTLVLAVSGGADSLALLGILCALRPLLKHRVRVVHIDHNLRPESAEEARDVAALCTGWDIPCAVRMAPVRDTKSKSNDRGIEETGRTLRYAILQEEREQNNAAWICTGHHSGDLAEDILLRLCRGSAWPALGGMPAVDPHRRILRPLLLCAPEALRAFVRDCGLSWAEDPSNADTRFWRNSLRHRVVPILREHNPSFLTQCCELWQRAHDDAAHWEHILNTLWQTYRIAPIDNTLTLPARVLHTLDRATRLRCYVRALREVAKLQVTLQMRHDILYRLDAAWLAQRNGTRLQVSGGFLAQICKGDVLISAHQPVSAAHAPGAALDGSTE